MTSRKTDCFYQQRWKWTNMAYNILSLFSILVTLPTHAAAPGASRVVDESVYSTSKQFPSLKHIIVSMSPQIGNVYRQTKDPYEDGMDTMRDRWRHHGGRTGIHVSIWTVNVIWKIIHFSFVFQWLYILTKAMRNATEPVFVFWFLEVYPNKNTDQTGCSLMVALDLLKCNNKN